MGRSPCGERGLKSGLAERTETDCWSLPVRGAWVEMPEDSLRTAADWLSLPVRGAWVEILKRRNLCRMGNVAPRAGSVG